MNKLISSIRSFVADEDGAQVVEYALVIAIISIGVALALESAIDGAFFDPFVTRINACFAGTAGCTALP